MEKKIKLIVLEDTLLSLQIEANNNKQKNLIIEIANLLIDLEDTEIDSKIMGNTGTEERDLAIQRVGNAIKLKMEELIQEKQNLHDHLNEVFSDKNEVYLVDLTEYDTTSLTEAGIDPEKVMNNHCEVDVDNNNALTITHDNNGTKLDVKIVLNLKN